MILIVPPNNVIAVFADMLDRLDQTQSRMRFMTLPPNVKVKLPVLECSEPD